MNATDLYSDTQFCQPIYPHADLTQNSSILVTLIVSYGVVALFAFCGNILVIWTVWHNTHMQTSTNYYIVNLAIADLLVGTIVLPLKLVEYAGPCSWNIFYQDALCSFLSYTLPVFVFASVLTLVAISIERCVYFSFFFYYESFVVIYLHLFI